MQHPPQQYQNKKNNMQQQSPDITKTIVYVIFIIGIYATWLWDYIKNKNKKDKL